MSKKVIALNGFTTVDELIDTLKVFQDLARTNDKHAVLDIEDQDGTKLGYCRLIEETLSDGSKVYNAELS
jgi:hypothetical protein